MRNHCILAASWSLLALAACTAPSESDSTDAQSDDFSTIREPAWTDCRVFRITASPAGTATHLTLTQEGGSPLVLDYSVPGEGDPQLDNPNWYTENRIQYFWADFLARAALRESEAGGPFRASLCLADVTSSKPLVLSPTSKKSPFNLSVYMKNTTETPLSKGEVALPHGKFNYYNVAGDSEGVVVQASDPAGPAIGRMLPYNVSVSFVNGYTTMLRRARCGPRRASSVPDVPHTQLECKFYKVLISRAPYGVEGELLMKEMFESQELLASPSRDITWSAIGGNLAALVAANPGCTLKPIQSVECVTEFPVTIAKDEQYVSFHPLDMRGGGLGVKNGEVIEIRNADGTPAAATRIVFPSIDRLQYGLGRDTPFFGAAGRAWDLPAGNYIVVVKSFWGAFTGNGKEQVTLKVEAGRTPRTP